ncbi:MAG: metal-dependent transcriptional regulator [Promethearchaeota archaeon]
MVNPTKNIGKYSNKQSNKTINKPLSEKEEEILEYIGKLFEKNQKEFIKRLKIAEILSCSPSLVNKLLKSLEKKGLIIYEKYGVIELTDEGALISKALIRKHRLSEALFVNLLGLEASESHEFACKLEHIINDKLLNRIEEILNNPTVCPHGNPVPSNNNQKTIIKGFPLSSFSINDIVTVSQITHESTTFLRNLSQMGIEVGTKIKILEKSLVDDTLLLEINGKNLSLGEKTAENLLVVLYQDGET